MRYSQIRSMDINNGPGICVSLYVQGCKRHCEKCFNPNTWDYEGGELWNRRVEFQFIEACKKEYIKNICILGGEPLDQEKELFDLLIKLKEEVDKPIWLWTGYTWEEIVRNSNERYQQFFGIDRIIKEEILTMCDVVIDGPFVYEKMDTSLKYRGSTNQRVINVKKTLEQDKIVLYGEA